MFCSLRKRLVVLFNRGKITVKFRRKYPELTVVKHFLRLCCFLEETFIFFYETIKWMFGNPRKGNEA